MSLCSASTCPAPATVMYTARGAGGYRAALACEEHRPATRRWVAGAGPNVTETPIALAPDQQPATLF